ncbi:MAG: VOC family protein [Paenibacillus sp.]|uniref:PhnB protein n=1 Tax=Paenibacillus aquistagni TaxID=1852522 RepID=A0A1X7I7Z3_9BACL|nr:VOC family protein [Paenibacillus aquistagni]MBR2569504.1 VOC family protein [Paenibacillus sp.]SMG10704.1 PhnB protein [Paenibacillus aquistagni]
MAVNVYLNFNGNCREAVLFYADVFGTEKPHIMTFGEQPPNPEYPLPEEAKDLVMHARLMISDSNVMFSDTFPGMPFVLGNNVSLAIVTHSREDIENWFHKLKVGGKVGMELQETFWSKCYGQITDQFGIEWQLSLEEAEGNE